MLGFFIEDYCGLDQFDPRCHRTMITGQKDDVTEKVVHLNDSDRRFPSLHRSNSLPITCNWSTYDLMQKAMFMLTLQSLPMVIDNSTYMTAHWKINTNHCFHYIKNNYIKNNWTSLFCSLKACTHVQTCCLSFQMNAFKLTIKQRV